METCVSWLNGMSKSPAQQRVSLRDIADELGISHVSVSLALRDSPRVSEKRKKEIREVAERLGYRPDPMLTALAAYRKQKGGVGIHSALAWINQWEDKDQLRRFKEFDAYWNGAKDAAQHLGFHLEEFRVNEDLTGKRLSDILKARCIRGILLPPHSKGIHLEGFDWDYFSIVRFGFSVKQSRVHLVGSDMVGNALLAYQKMLDNGYTRIGMVTEKHFDQNIRHNVNAGFLAAQNQHLLHSKQLPPLFFDVTKKDQHAKQLLKWIQRYKPDSILTSEPKLKDLLIELGYRIPEDIAVAGTSILDAPYDTGIDQNSYEIGRVAVSVLTGLIHENETGIPSTIRRTMIDGHWVQGKSLPAIA